MADLTPNEKRLKETIKRMQAQNLTQQQTIRVREAQLERVCDDLLGAGNDAETLRGYYPEYKTPEEREENKQ